MDLERELRALAGQLDWPPTPELRPTLVPRRRDFRRPLVAAAALAIAVVAAAFAVPQSRAAILRFLHLGGATIQFVGTLPAAEEAPLAGNLGPTLSEADARALLAGSLLLPRLAPQAPLHAQGQIVSMLFLNRGQAVLLSEANTGSAVFLKKLASSATSATAVRVGPDPGVWLSGAPHVVFFPGAPARLAGNVLIWQQGPLTLRLEGRHLTEVDAFELAAALRYDDNASRLSGLGPVEWSVSAARLRMPGMRCVTRFTSRGETPRRPAGFDCRTGPRRRRRSVVDGYAVASAPATLRLRGVSRSGIASARGVS